MNLLHLLRDYKINVNNKELLKENDECISKRNILNNSIKNHLKIYDELNVIYF